MPGRSEDLDTRLDAMKKRQQEAKVTIPSYYADNDVRRARLKVIRKRMGMTQTNFAMAMGMSAKYYMNLEEGYTSMRAIVTMTHLRLAETLFQAFRQKQNRLRVKQEKARQEGFQAAKRTVISRFIKGETPEEIAADLKLNIDDVMGCIADVE